MDTFASKFNFMRTLKRKKPEHPQLDDSREYPSSSPIVSLKRKLKTCEANIRRLEKRVRILCQIHREDRAALEYERKMRHAAEEQLAMSPGVAAIQQAEAKWTTLCNEQSILQNKLSVAESQLQRVPGAFHCILEEILCEIVRVTGSPEQGVFEHFRHFADRSLLSEPELDASDDMDVELPAAQQPSIPPPVVLQPVPIPQVVFHPQPQPLYHPQPHLEFQPRPQQQHQAACLQPDSASHPDNSLPLPTPAPSPKSTGPTFTHPTTLPQAQTEDYFSRRVEAQARAPLWSVPGAGDDANFDCARTEDNTSDEEDGEDDSDSDEEDDDDDEPFYHQRRADLSIRMPKQTQPMPPGVGDTSGLPTP